MAPKRLSLVGILGILASSCAIPQGPTAWRLDWHVEAGKRYRDSTAESLLSLPPLLSGEETWWAFPDRLIIENVATLSRGDQGMTRTWILPRQRWVYSLDIHEGVIHGIPLQRWNEERLRQARRSMVETHRVASVSPRAAEFRWFHGDLKEKEIRDSTTLLAAVPGRVWRLKGHKNFGGAWGSPYLPLGFDGISQEQALQLGQILWRHSPRTIEDIPLSRGASTVVVKRRIRTVSRVHKIIEHFHPPAREVQQIQEREQQWRAFAVLWRFLEDPEARPPALDYRGVRVRLEALVEPTDAPTIRERIRNTTDMQEREELFHLLFVADPQLFDDWLQGARERGELTQVLAMISVLSLRRPDGVIPLIDRIQLEDSQLWQGIEGTQSREARSWLQGVRMWVSTRES
ncbi:MAG: hypothetical protein V3T77_06805 [Planctomycetota bacterium]